MVGVMRVLGVRIVAMRQMPLDHPSQSLWGVMVTLTALWQRCRGWRGAQRRCRRGLTPDTSRCSRGSIRVEVTGREGGEALS